MSITRLNTADANVATRLTAKPQARHRGPRLPFGLIVLNQVGWVALALFFTAGFAIALSTFTGRSALEPDLLTACALFFGWSSILLGSMWNA
jgi:hypothetical protein